MIARNFHEQRQELLRELLERPSGQAWSDKYTDLVDSTIKSIFHEVEDRFTRLPSLSLVAVGGYGRSHLAPHSDLDIALIPLDENQENLEEVVRMIYRRLHEVFQDQEKIDVEYGYRLVSDAAALDPTTRTSFLDARPVAGSMLPFDRFMDAYWDNFPTGDFLIAKLQERAEWLERTHSTPLVTAPHLKDGAGGLRCVSTARWIGAAIGIRIPVDQAALEIVLGARNLLHALQQNKADVMTPSGLQKICECLQAQPQDWMSLLLRAMETNHQSFRIARERIQEARFNLDDGVLAIKGEVRVLPEARPSTAAFGIARATQLNLLIGTHRMQTTGAIDGDALIRALAEGEPTLRNLDKCGLLGQWLPELEACRTLLPDDLTHRYTVYEHTLHSIQILESLQQSPTWLGTLYREFENKPAIHLALLLHDVGKKIEHMGHAEHGAQIADLRLRDWRLQTSQRELVVWLIRNHLEMARAMRFRDVALPETWSEFALKVGDSNRLQALTLMTYADSRAVSDDVWSPMQESFLQDLYEGTLKIFEVGKSTAPPEQIRAKTRRQLASQPVEQTLIDQFVESLPASYLMVSPHETVVSQLRLTQQCLSEGTQIEAKQLKEMRATEIIICTPDAPGLLSRILGILYAAGLSVLSVRAFTTRSETPIAVDTFVVTYNNGIVPDATLSRVRQLFLSHIQDEASVDALLLGSGKDPDRMEEDPEFRFSPGALGVLEVNTRRGRGMAFRLSRLIARLGWDIKSARIGQWAGKGAAAFYITGSEDRRLSEQEVLEALQARVSSTSSI